MATETLAPVKPSKLTGFATPQQVFDRIQELKEKLSSKRAERREELMGDNEFKKLSEQGTDIGRKKKKITDAWDEENPRAISTIDDLADKVDLENETLSKLIQDALKRGEPVKLFRTLKSGKRKLVNVKLIAKISSKQGTLF